MDFFAWLNKDILTTNAVETGDKQIVKEKIFAKALVTTSNLEIIVDLILQEGVEIIVHVPVKI